MNSSPPAPKFTFSTQPQSQSPPMIIPAILISFRLDILAPILTVFVAYLEESLYESTSGQTA